MLEHIQKTPGRIVLAGDFNFVRDSPLYESLACMLSDITEGLKEIEFNGYKQVDYIFTNFGNTVQPIYLKYEDKFPSDHPLIAVSLK